jgi:branched-subunit amino acid aminotransferase/4-amino-4-deoxychorismate lyase
MARGERAHPDPCDALRLLRLRGRARYGGKIFESRRHSERLLSRAELDMPIPWTVDEIEAAKYEVLKANGLTDAYVRAVAWRGAGEDMGVSPARNPVRLAIAAWEWGAYYGDSQVQGRQARHLQVEASLAPRRSRSTPRRPVST